MLLVMSGNKDVKIGNIDIMVAACSTEVNMHV